MSGAILVVEDDAALAESIRGELLGLGYDVEIVGDGRSGLEAASRPERNYVLVVLDVMLPGLSGMEVCAELHKTREELPIILLTSRADEADRILGLHVGADDYIVKPFSPRELVARAKAVIRRSKIRADRESEVKGEGVLRFGSLVIDLRKRKVTRDNAPVELTALEFDLLAFFAVNAGCPYSREDLAHEVWGYDSSSYTATVTTTLSRLRSKIEPDPLNPKFILTVRGVGYRFTELHELAGGSGT